MPVLGPVKTGSNPQKFFPSFDVLVK